MVVIDPRKNEEKVASGHSSADPSVRTVWKADQKSTIEV